MGDLSNDVLDLQVETDVLRGDRLVRWACQADGYKKRFVYKQLSDFLMDERSNKIAVLCGLRRTGKTTMIAQAIQELTAIADANKTALVTLTRGNNMKELLSDVRKLEQDGVKYLFIDGVTELSDFDKSVAALPDIYACLGMKIVLSGTQSLLFKLVKRRELYDRTVTIYTTFISFAEYKHIHEDATISDFMRRGGVALAPDESPFGTRYGANDYSYTAIAENIQQSLLRYRDGVEFHGLYDVYTSDELLDLIYRVLYHGVRTTTMKSIGKKFEYVGGNVDNIWFQLHDTVGNVISHESKREDTRVKDFPDLKAPVTERQVSELRNYLLWVNSIYPLTKFKDGPRGNSSKELILTQPGLRYMIAMDVIPKLMQDTWVSAPTVAERRAIFDRMEACVQSMLLEEHVLIELSVYARNKWGEASEYHPWVSQATFVTGGEIDAIVVTPFTHNVICVEVKNTDKCEPVRDDGRGQCRWLSDTEIVKEIQGLYGDIIRKIVVYLGPTKKNVYEGVDYVNVEEFLLNLGDIIK